MQQAQLSAAAKATADLEENAGLRIDELESKHPRAVKLLSGNEAVADSAQPVCASLEAGDVGVTHRAGLPGPGVGLHDAGVLEPIGVWMVVAVLRLMAELNWRACRWLPSSAAPSTAVAGGKLLEAGRLGAGGYKHALVRVA